MKLLSILSIVGIFFLVVPPAFAENNSEVANFTTSTLSILITFASLGTVLFLIKGGYSYITSNGKPDELLHAKTTIRNALLGLVLVLSASFISSLLSHAFTTPSIGMTTSPMQLQPIEPIEPSNGLTKVLLDAMTGFIQTIVQSAAKPLINGVMSFLTTTPSFISNSVIFNFWLTIVGITDSLFALVIALLGFQFMSAATFGFDELDFKHLLPRIGLAFLGANTSLFLAEWLVQLSNTLVHTLLTTTGGLTNAWILQAINPTALTDKSSVLITLIFMLLFVILTVVLLLFYITRLITLALGAVLSPLIFLLLALPKFSDFAEIAMKSYIVTIFTVFVHVVIIQLASSFLTIPGQTGTNSLISLLIGIGLLFTLLKSSSFMVQLMFYNTGRATLKKLGGQVINVITERKNGAYHAPSERMVNMPRKVMAA